MGNGTTFGWATFHHDPHLDNLQNGRVCGSGIAFPITEKEDIHPYGMCVDVHMLKTNTDTYYDIDEPAQCMSASHGSYCRYYWSDWKWDYFEMRCHCGMSGGVGYCPLAGPNTVAYTGNLEQQVLAES